MTEAEKLKNEWLCVQKALENLIQLPQDNDCSKIFLMLVTKKQKLEQELLEYYEPLVWVVQFKLKTS